MANFSRFRRRARILPLALALALAILCGGAPRCHSQIDQPEPNLASKRALRGTVVNSAHIALARRDELGHLTLTLKGRKDEIPVSRQFAHLFKQM